MRIVFPGDTVTVQSVSGQPIYVSKGLVQHGEQLRVTQPGLLVSESRELGVQGVGGGRYVPWVGDSVLGVCLGSAGEYYRIDIGSQREGLLLNTAFEGATKRNRPNISTGSILLCRVLAANKDMSAQLTCLSPAEFQTKDWVTGESLFGVLEGGILLRIPLHHDPSRALDQLGEILAFEAAIGANGRIWLKSSTARDTVLACSAIQASIGLSSISAIRTLMQGLAPHFKEIEKSVK
jgi:exosome complex component RRP40